MSYSNSQVLDSRNTNSKKRKGKVAQVLQTLEWDEDTLKDTDCETILEILGDLDPSEHPAILRSAQVSILAEVARIGSWLITGAPQEYVSDHPGDWHPGLTQERELADQQNQHNQQTLYTLKTVVQKYCRLGCMEFMQVFEALYGSKLHKNMLTRQVELTWVTGKAPQVYHSGLKLLAELERAIGVSMPNPQAFQRHYDLLVEDRLYNPFQEYLEGLQPMPKADRETLKASLVQKVFGKSLDDDEYLLDTELLWHWVLAIVARTYKPGCSNRGALVLYSKQGGTGKGTFFRCFGGGSLSTDGAYYTSYNPRGNEYASQEARLTGVIREIEEIENFTAKRELADIRSLLSDTRWQLNRKNQQPEWIDDAGVWGISTNKKDIYNDHNTTRFYTLRVTDSKHSIDNVWLATEGVELVYRAAVSEFKERIGAGETNFWALSKSLEDMSVARNTQYAMVSPWTEKAKDTLDELTDWVRQHRASDQTTMPSFKLSYFYGACGARLGDKVAIGLIREYLESQGYKLDGNYKEDGALIRAAHVPGVPKRLITAIG